MIIEIVNFSLLNLKIDKFLIIYTKIDIVILLIIINIHFLKFKVIYYNINFKKLDICF